MVSVLSAQAIPVQPVRLAMRVATASDELPARMQVELTSIGDSALDAETCGTAGQCACRARAASFLCEPVKMSLQSG